jgi:hypothetical protein
VTALLIGLAIGLFAAVVVAGYRHGRTIYTRQFDTECHEFGCDTSLEDAIPEWVNRGNGVWPPIVVDLDAFVDAIDELVRQQQLEDSAPWN